MISLTGRTQEHRNMGFINGVLAALFAVFAILMIVLPGTNPYRKAVIFVALVNAFNLLFFAAYGQMFRYQGALGVTIFMVALIASTVNYLPKQLRAAAQAAAECKNEDI